MAETVVLGRHEGGRHGWILAAIGLAAFGVLCGMALALGELQAFYISLSLIVAIAVLFDFRVGAFLLVLVVPFGATQFFPHNLFGVTGLNPLNLLLVATLASYLLRYRVAALLPKPLLWLYLAPILAAGALGLQHVQDIAPAFYESLLINYTDGLGYFREQVIRPLLIVAAAMLVGAAAARSQRPERFIVALMLSLWLIGLIEIGFIAASGVRLGALASPAARTFFDALGLHANQLGRLFAVGYALLLFVWWETKDVGLKSALFATLCMCVVALVLSFSRSAYLAFLMVSGLFMLWKFNARSLSLALLAGGLAAVLMPGYVFRRLTFGFDADVNTVSADRIDGIWTPLLPELWKSPLWGNGIDSIMWSEPMKAGAMLVVGHPHNAYIQTFLDMGIIGLALIGAYYWHVWKGFRALGSNAYISPELRGFFQGAAAALLSMFVTGLSGDSLRPDVQWGPLWVAIGIMYAILARRPAS
ncbi:MAG TPA: O-antigen ligase family protein [Steroidobacteraceae bacterium]|nr:O-antigen ligase family protein [Steroidobacteraceae bacterium]